MTTANLSVGLDTTEAKASLLRLRREMEAQPHTLALNITSKEIDKEIVRYLDRRKFRITLGAANLNNLADTIKDAICGRHYQVHIDSSSLISEVRAAVQAGLSGGVVHLGGVSGAAGAPAAAVAAGVGIEAALKGAIASALLPAVDDLSKAALAITNVARKVGAGAAVESPRGVQGPDRSTLLALRDKTDRESRSSAQADSNRMFRFTRNWAKADAAGENRSDTLNRAEQLRRIRSQDAGEERSDLLNRAEQLRRLRSQSAGEERSDNLNRSEQLRRIRSQEAGEERSDVLNRAEQLRRTRAQSAGEERSDVLNRAEQLRRTRARAAGEERSDVLNRAEQLRRTRAQAAGEERSDLLNRAEHVRRVRAQAAGEERSDILNRAEQLRQARIRDREKVLNEAGQRASDWAKERQLRQAAVSASAASSAASTLAARDAQKALNHTMREGHSAARGLAGSMGAMWATYGSVVPLVAAAALGASLKSVISVGKDLEYQLTFVSELTDKSAVSTTRLSQAMAGSVVGPVAAAEAMRGLAQNGLDVNEAFTALPAILSLSTAGEMSLMEAALGATGVMTAFNKEVSDLGNISDVFAKAAAMSNTDVRGMVESMRQASTVGDQFNVTMEETSASLVMMAKRNITGTAAGTAFRNMMKELASPTKEAKKAVDDLGLKFYDSAGKLKPLQVNLEQLKQRLGALNEESRLAFIERIFGERGGKAANAILSDLDAYNSAIDTLKNKSAGFSQVVTDALAKTTDGRIKLLFSEFQTEAAKAFDGASGGLNNFIESLRSLVRSEEFRSGLSSLISGVNRLTTFLIEHGRQVVAILTLWAGTKVLAIAATLFYGIGKGALAASVGLGTMSVAAKGALASLTGGLSLVVGLGLEFLLLSRSTDQAAESDRAMMRAMDNGNATLDERIKKMSGENAQLARKIELMRQGKTEEQATVQVAGEDDKKESVDLDRLLATKRQELVSARANVARARSGFEGVNKALAEEKRLAKDVATLEEEKSKKTVEQRQIMYQQLANEEKRRLTAVADFNKRVSEMGAKAKGLELPISLVDADLTQKTFDDQIEKAKARLNAIKESRKLPDSSADSQVESERLRIAKAGVQSAIEQIHEEEAALAQSAKFRRDLDAAKYNPNLFGQQISAYLAEQREIMVTTESLKLQERAVEKLKEAKANLALDPADKLQIDTAIKKEESKLQLGREALRNQQQIAQANAVERARQEAFDDKKLRGKLGVEDAQEVDKIRLGYSNKSQDPAIAAMMTAQLAVQSRYAGDIQKYTEKTEESEAAIAALMARQWSLSEEDAVREAGTVAVLRETLALQQSRLAILKAQASSASGLAGSVAGFEFQRSQEAGYGWDQFWSSYTSSAQSNASIVEGIMKSTTGNMTDAFVQFTTTSKSSFRGFAASVAQTAASMLANKAISQLLNLAVNLALGGGGASTNGNGGYSFGGQTFNNPSAYTLMANGGVMTPYGALPLHKYAKGGIEHGPALSLHGEGSLPEANVPLADGRTIPVTLKGGVGGGGNTSVSISINIDSNGESSVESDASGNQARQLGAMIETGVMQVIQREKRNGGLLYA